MKPSVLRRDQSALHKFLQWVFSDYTTTAELTSVWQSCIWSTLPKVALNSEQARLLLGISRDSTWPRSLVLNFALLQFCCYRGFDDISGNRHQSQHDYGWCMMLSNAIALTFSKVWNITPKGLFTWREGAPANQATRLGELKQSPPFYATHLSGIASGLSFELPLSITNKMDKRNVFAASFNFFITRSANGRFSVSKAVVLHSI